MSLIVCTDPCVYQKDGYCSLSRAASLSDLDRSGCINFVPLQQSGHGLPDIGDPDELQPIRGVELPVDPLGDQAFGKA